MKKSEFEIKFNVASFKESLLGTILGLAYKLKKRQIELYSKLESFFNEIEFEKAEDISYDSKRKILNISYNIKISEELDDNFDELLNLVISTSLYLKVSTKILEIKKIQDEISSLEEVLECNVLYLINSHEELYLKDTSVEILQGISIFYNYSKIKEVCKLEISRLYE